MKETLFKFINRNHYVSFIAFLILLISLIMYLRDFRMMTLDTWPQYIQPTFLYHDFFKSLLYFHGNPPGGSIINYVANLISFGNKNAFFEIVLPIFHCVCFYLFYKVLIIKQIPYSKIIAAVLFLNPLIFIYFKLPFYSTFIFISSCLLLYLWTSKDINDNKRLLYTAIIFSFNCLLRSSWHIAIVFIFLIPFLLKANKRYRIISLAILIIPLLVFIKNYILFDRFVSSSWGPMNLCRAHIPWECMDRNKISIIGTFSYPKDYQPFVSNDYLQQKYKDVPILNQQDYNNVIYFAVGDLYMKELKKCFNIKWSISQSWQGVFYFFRSPVNFLYLKKRAGGILEDNIYFCYDFFNISENPDSELNPRSEAKSYYRNLSPYTFIYIFVILYFIINIKQLERNEKLIFLLTLFFTGTYMTIDFYESNRMRFEIEPFYYYFTILAFSSISNNISRPNSFSLLLINKGWVFFKKNFNTIIIISFSIILICCTLSYTLPIIKKLFSKTPKNVIDVSLKLHEKGMKNSSEVLGFSSDFYDNDSPLKSGFNTPWHDNPSFVPYHSMNDIKIRMAKNKERFLIYTKDSKSEIPGLLSFWDSKLIPKEFSVIYNEDGITLLQLDTSFWGTLKVATPEDFKKFVSTNPTSVTNENSYQDPDSKDFYFNLFQENGNWAGHEWHRDNVLPLWKKYKEDHNLL